MLFFFFSRGFNKTSSSESVQEVDNGANRFQGQNVYEQAFSTNETDQNENVFKCHVCGKVCKNKVGLSSHMRIHSKMEPVSIS